MHTHTRIKHRWNKRGKGSLGYRILCLRISYGMRIRATVVRLTHAKQNPHGKPTANRWAYVRLHTNRKTWKPNANCWTYIKLRTNKHTQETNCQSLDLRQTPNTHKGVEKEKGRPERSAHLLPTYLIWYEDQGDVVPLQRDKGLA